MADNIKNASGGINANPMIGIGGYQNLFAFTHENPDAKVILNRNSVFENDISDWVTSFSTTNSVDDIVGSFNVVLNNENDRFVDRYNNVKIAPAASIEIFVKTASDSGSSNDIADRNPATNSNIIQVPEKLLRTGEKTGSLTQKTVTVASLLQEVIRQQYPGVATEEDQSYYVDKITKLNATKVVGIETMSDTKADAMFGDAVQAQNNEGQPITKAIKITTGKGAKPLFDSNHIPLLNGDGSPVTGKIVTAIEFFQSAKATGRKGSKQFLTTDLVIQTDGTGGFVRSENGLYVFDSFNVEGDNAVYPMIRSALTNLAANGGNFADTVYSPVIKSSTVPFLMKDASTPATDVVLAPGDVLRVPPLRTSYRRIFFGIVVNISQNIAPGGALTITLNGKSLGYWLEASVINTHPAVEQAEYQGAEGQLTGFANKFADSSALDVFRDLIKYSTDDLVTLADFSLDSNPVGADYLLVEGMNLGSPVKDAQGNIILEDVKDANGKTQRKPKTFSNNPIDREIQLESAYEELYTKAQPFDGGKNGLNATDAKKWKDLSTAYNVQNTVALGADAQAVRIVKDITDAEGSKYPSLAEKQKAIDKLRDQLRIVQDKGSKAREARGKAKASMNALPVVDLQIKTIQKNVDENNQQWTQQLKTGRNALLDESGISKHWQRIFSSLVLEVLDSESASVNSEDLVKKGFLANVHPFKWETSSPGWMDGDYQSKADIGRTVAQNIMYEFYFDTNGHFVLKPPLFSISNQNNDADYILTDKDIFSININDTLDGIITRMDIVGAYYESPSTPNEMIKNVFQDFNLIKNYGVFSRQISNLLFIRNIADCRAFGRAFMSKNNVELKNATVTIYGRPEIRLGTSIYLQPRDTVYYIKAISHDFNVGDGVTTTLTLVGARRIIRGFAAKKTVSQYYKTYNKDGSFRISKEAKSEGRDFLTNASEIDHYIPLNATNFSNLPLSSQSTLNDQLNAQLNVDNGGEFGNNVITENAVRILENMFIVTSHPNQALIGLLVDGDSALVSQINQNYYKFLNGLVGKDGYVSIQLSSKPTIQTHGQGQSQLFPNEKPEVVQAAAEHLTHAFKVFTGQTEASSSNFAVDYGFNESSIKKLKKENNGSDFDYAMLRSFLTSQYRKIQNKIESGVSVSDRAVYNDLDLQRQILDLLMKDIDALGSYARYTDAEGREWPSYVDFGSSLTMVQTDTVLSDFDTRNDRIESERQRLSRAAQKALGTNTKNANVENKKIENAVKYNGSQPITRVDAESGANTATARAETTLEDFGL